MRPGEMDRHVVVQKRTVVGQNDYGEEIYSWTDVDVWARRRDLRGDERYAAQQTLSKITCKYHIRYRTDIDVKDRLVDDGQTYDIHAVLPIRRREGLELLVSGRGGE